MSARFSRNSTPTRRRRAWTSYRRVSLAAYAAVNKATLLVLSDPDERDTGSAYPIFNFPTHIFIDSGGLIRSIVLEDMNTEQAVAEANRLLDTDTVAAEPVPAS